MERRECRGWGTSTVCSPRGREDRDPPPYLLSRLSLTEYGSQAITIVSSPFWRRQWHPTPVLLPGKSHGWRSLVG